MLRNQSISRLSSIPFNLTNKIKSDYSISKLKSDFTFTKSKLGSTLDRLILLNKDKKELNKKLPFIIKILQCFLSLINFFLFCIYVLLFGVSLSSVISAINEDCLKIEPNYKVIPEKVTPTQANGYDCTGIRLIKKDDYYQYFYLSILVLGIGLQMISSNLAFIGSFTLTTKNIRVYIYLFVISTILLISFFIIDFQLEMGRQYLRYFGVFNNSFLFVMLAVSLSQVFSAFFSLILLLKWNTFVKDANKII